MIIKQKSGQIQKQNRQALALHRRKRVFGILLFCVFLFAFAAGGKKAEAAGASVDIDTKSKTVVKGDTLYVVITVESTEAIQGFQGYFSYDNRYLRFVTGGSVVHGNDDEFEIEDMDRDSSATKIKYSIKFKARKKGSCTIALKQPYNVIADDDSDTKMSVSHSDLNLVIMGKKAWEKQQNKAAAATQAPAEASAAPSAAAGEPGGVPSGEKGETGEAPAGEPGETPSGEAAAGEAGEAQEQGAPASAAPDAAQEEGAETDSGEKGNVTVTEKKGVTVVSGKTKITLTEPGEDVEIPDGFAASDTEIDGVTVASWTLEAGKNDQIVLLYGKDGDGEEGFYLYDGEADMIFPYEKVKAWYRYQEDASFAAEAYEKQITGLKYIIAIMAVFCLLVLVLARLIRRRN